MYRPSLPTKEFERKTYGKIMVLAAFQLNFENFPFYSNTGLE